MKGLALFNVSALLSCCAFFALTVGCTNDDTVIPDQREESIKVDTTSYKDPETGEIITKVDTLQQSVDTVTTIDENGDSIVVYDTIYVSKDTTLHWVGNSALRITEIVPINLDWLDENGDDGSWVEIYNAGDKSANLKGYSLIENTKAAKKWIFGNEIVPAKKFRIVFCDKKDVSDAASKDSELGHSRTHTNWKMEKDGGTVYLVDRNYGIRDSVQFPELEPGVSWGITDGGSWKYFEKPTPEASNTNSPAFEGMAPVVDLSQLKAGFYSEPITLNPPTLESGVSLRCTQNGSLPTKDSQEFNSPIYIEKNTVLRCAAFKEGTITKSVTTKTFFIDETVNMPVVAVTVDSAFFRENYLTHLSCSDPKTCPSGLMADVEHPVHVEYFAEGSSSAERAWEIDAGISLMGNWSRVFDKKTVAINMREQYQAGWLNYPLFETRKETSHKFKAFNLRNNGNRFASDYIEDAAGGAILEGSGVDYQRSRQVVVFYNGRYYGIHDMRERYNKNYVETNYGIDASSVNFIKHIGREVTASNGTVDDYVAMLNFVAGGDMTNADNYAMAKTLLDVGNFADYMATEIYSHNGDWPVNNVRAWRSPEQLWKFMVYDLDHGYGWQWGTDGFSDHTNMFSWIKQGGTTSGKCHSNKDPLCFHNLYVSLIKNPDFKRLFVNRSAVMLQNYLNGERVAKVVDAMVATMDAGEMERDLEKFEQDKKYYPDGFSKSGSTIKAWAKERDGVVLSEYKSEFGLSDLVSVSIGANGNGIVLMEGMRLPGGSSYSGKFFAGNSMELTAIPADGAMFGGWSDGSNDNPHVVPITEGLNITANFK